MGLSGVKLDELQGDFAGLVLAGETSEAISVAGRLPLDRADLWRCSIYRSHYANASADALAASYPAIARYLGTSRFRDLAVTFARQCPPAQAALCMFGGGFEVF
ncbi:MAG: putative DNA-binding domain-containing protein, partial [Pseudomonadota bacterium]